MSHQLSKWFDQQDETEKTQNGRYLMDLSYFGEAVVTNVLTAMKFENNKKRFMIFDYYI